MLSGTRRKAKWAQTAQSRPSCPGANLEAKYEEQHSEKHAIGLIDTDNVVLDQPKTSPSRIKELAQKSLKLLRGGSRVNDLVVVGDKSSTAAAAREKKKHPWVTNQKNVKTSMQIMQMPLYMLKQRVRTEVTNCLLRREEKQTQRLNRQVATILGADEGISKERASVMQPRGYTKPYEAWLSARMEEKRVRVQNSIQDEWRRGLVRQRVVRMRPAAGAGAGTGTGPDPDPDPGPGPNPNPGAGAGKGAVTVTAGKGAVTVTAGKGAVTVTVTGAAKYGEEGTIRSFFDDAASTSDAVSFESLPGQLCQVASSSGDTDRQVLIERQLLSEIEVLQSMTHSPEAQPRRSSPWPRGLRGGTR
jgi:hypothetical protein